MKEQPYESVWLLRKDPWKHAQMLEAMSKEASAVGVKNFKTLYAAYEKNKSRNTDLIYTPHSTDFQGQKFELDVGDWEADDMGVRRGTGNFEEVACPHPIAITERIVNIDTGLEKLRLEWSKGKRWRSIIVPRNTLASPREIVKLADTGITVNGRTAPYLCDFFMDIETLNYDKLPERKSVTRLGWIDGEGFSPFVDGLLFDGETAYSAMFDAIGKHGKFDAWLDAAKAFRKESIAARIVMAAALASVLVKPLGVLPFFVHLWGVDSSTGKTVALLAAASVWGCPEMGKYVKTFDGTDVGYERTAAFLNSLPMCIDELQLAKNARGQVVFNPYKLAQGAGRSRGNKSGGIDTTPTWACAFITTGETPLTTLASGAGAINRVIEVECTSEEKVVQDGRQTVQAFKKNYGFAGKMFVDKLNEEGFSEAEQLYNAAFDKLNANDTTDKQAIAAALCVAADQLATKWIFKDGNALTVEDISRFLATRAAVSTGARGYQYMCDWVSLNINKLKPDVENGEVYGLVDGDWCYIIGAVFRKTCEEAGFSYQALLSYLSGSGLIKKSRDGKTTVTKWIGGTSPRCVCLLIRQENQPEDGELDPYEDVI